MQSEPQMERLGADVAQLGIMDTGSISTIITPQPLDDDDDYGVSEEASVWLMYERRLVGDERLLNWYGYLWNLASDISTLKSGTNAVNM